MPWRCAACVAILDLLPGGDVPCTACALGEEGCSGTAGAERAGGPALSAEAGASSAGQPIFVAGLTLQLCHGCCLPFQASRFWEFIGTPPSAELTPEQQSRAVVDGRGNRFLLLCGQCSNDWLRHHALRGIRLPTNAAGVCPREPEGGVRCASRRV